MTVTQPPIQFITHLSEHLDNVSAVICDLWGVMHDGVDLFPDALCAIERLREASIPVVFLSNAPRPISHVRGQLAAMGMPVELLDMIVTSGALACQAVRADFKGAQLYHMGPSSDGNLLQGLPVTLVPDIDKADVILASGLDYSTVDEHFPDMTVAAGRNIPLICANPDRIVHVGNELWICAGAVADLYEAIGGKVIWTGKPAPLAMQACLIKLRVQIGDQNDINPKDILVIGDGLPTDIAGAKAFGAQSLLVSGGIHSAEVSSLVRHLGSKTISSAAFLAEVGEDLPIPDRLIPTLKW